MKAHQISVALISHENVFIEENKKMLSPQNGLLTRHEFVARRTNKMVA